MKNIRFLTPALIVLALAAGPAMAATWTWTGTAGDGLWTTLSNWTDGTNAPTEVPGTGGTAGDNIFINLSGTTVDLGTTSVSVGQLKTDVGNITIQGTGTITAAEIYNDDRSPNVDYYPNLVVTGRIYNRNKGAINNFYGTVSADSLDLGASAPLFHQAVTITNATDGLLAFYRTIRTGGNNNWKFDDVLNASKVRIWSDVAGQTSTVSAQGADTLSGVTGTVTIDAGGILNLVTAQNTPPGGGILVNQSGLLLGTTGSATWGAVGSGADIEVADGAVLAVDNGPTYADLGNAALAYYGITEDGTFEYGPDGTSGYKAMAFGIFTTGDYAGKTLRAPSGSGNLALAWLPGAPSAVVGNLILESLDQTGVADINAFTTLSFKGGQWNATPTADSCTTFNIVSQLAANGVIADFEQANDFTISGDQTFNFSGAGQVDLAPTTTLGLVNFSGETMLTVSGDGQFPDVATAPNAKLTFGAGTAISVGSGDVLAFEQMSPSQIVVDPGAVLTLETGGSNDPLVFTPQFDITDTNNPRLVEIMKSVNVMVKGGNNNYADLQGDGIQLGDGKYLIGYSDSHKGVYLRADASSPNAMIHGAGPGTTMGIGCASNNGSDYLGIYMPIDAHGGTVLLNSADPVLYVLGGSNTRGTGPADQSVRLYGTINNAAEVVVLNKEVEIRSDTIDDGTLTGGMLPIRVAGTGDLSLDAGVANLDKTQFTIEQGGRVLVDSVLTVKNVILNSTYAAGNDGLQINSADDAVVVTGTLSGNGGWGGSGKILVDSGANVAPGNSEGALTGGDIELADGSVYDWQFSAASGDPGIDWDAISAANVNISGGLTFNPEELGTVTLGSGDEFIVISATGDITGPNFDAGTGVLAGVSFGNGWSGTLTRVDNSGTTGTVDLILSGLSSSTSADINGDGVIDAADYILLKQNWGEPDSASATAAACDLDGSGTVGIGDLDLFAAAIDGAAGGAAVTPEPATLALLAFGGLAVIRRRRRS